MNNQVEFLIIGQGIAGSNLALTLLKHGKKIAIIDNGHKSSASKVAAGILNPVTGIKMVKSWKTDLYLPYAKNFYKSLEKELNTRFFHEKELLRLFAYKDEITQWEKRKANPEYTHLLGSKHEEGKISSSIIDPLGSFSIEGTSHIDLNRFLHATKAYFESQELYICSEFIAEDLKITNDSVQWKDIEAKYVVFCQGWKTDSDPWFKDLPYKHAKGEILTLRADADSDNKMLNKKKWILPLEDKIFRIGSTYDWDQLNQETTDAAKEELLSVFNSMIHSNSDVEVIEHAAGVRPCSHDTRPYIGRHPEHQNLIIFNGFGSKGTFLSPLCSEQLFRHLEYGDELDPEIDILRVKK